jgi:subtilisin family serine protease
MMQRLIAHMVRMLRASFLANLAAQRQESRRRHAASSFLCMRFERTKRYPPAIRRILHGGALSPDAGMLDALAKALARAADRNVLIVVAAEGDGNEHFHVPTAASTVLAVAAEDTEGKLLDFGMWGPTYRDSGIVARGESIVGAAPGGGTVTQSGATFAAGFVAGIAALFLAIQQSRGQKPDCRAVRSALLQSATPLSAAESERGKGVLRGRLNIEAARKLL